ncbi:MAG TPA: glycosyltransferase, partial [Chitinophaga sp.]|nr:glycosyltransferase [Chitinophaga sp.]
MAPFLRPIGAKSSTPALVTGIISPSNQSASPMISIVIPVLNEGATLRQVIKTIKKTSRKIEIIVVDDDSNDNSVEEALKEKVRVITSS